MRKLRGFFASLAITLALFTSTASADPFTPPPPPPPIQIITVQLPSGEILCEILPGASIGYCGGDPVNCTDPMGLEWKFFRSESEAQYDPFNRFESWSKAFYDAKSDLWCRWAGNAVADFSTLDAEAANAAGILKANPTMQGAYGGGGVSSIDPRAAAALGSAGKHAQDFAEAEALTPFAGVAAYYVVPAAVAAGTKAITALSVAGGAALRYGQQVTDFLSFQYFRLQSAWNSILDRVPGSDVVLELHGIPSGRNPLVPGYSGGIPGPIPETETQKNFNQNYQPGLPSPAPVPEPPPASTPLPPATPPGSEPEETVTLFHGSRNWQGDKFSLDTATGNKKDFTPIPGVYLTTDPNRAATQYATPQGTVVTTTVPKSVADSMFNPNAEKPEWIATTPQQVDILNKNLQIRSQRDFIKWLFGGH